MSFLGSLFGRSAAAPQSSRDVYLKRWTSLKSQLKPELVANIEKWFTDYEKLGTEGDALLALPTLTEEQGITYRGQVDELLQHYQNTIRMRTLDSEEIKAFRNELMLPMMDELKAKQKQVIAKAPKPQVPAYVPEVTMQMQLDKLRRQGGKRKTRGRGRKTKRRYKRSMY